MTTKSTHFFPKDNTFLITTASRIKIQQSREVYKIGGSTMPECDVIACYLRNKGYQVQLCRATLHKSSLTGY